MIRRRLLSIVLALLLLCVVASRSLLGRVDTSAWRYYRLEALGVALLLPDDFVPDDAAGAVFHGKGAEVELTVTERDELYADAEALAAEIASGSERKTEVMTVGQAALVRLPDSDRSRADVCDLISPDGDTYRIRVEVDEAVRRRRAGKLLSAVAGSLCGDADVPAASAVVRVPTAARQSAVDELVLVNRRRALPENWADALDLVTTLNARGEAVRLERTACKAYFRLQRALAEEGVEIDLASAYGPDGEHPTGLALDLQPMGDEAWERVRRQLAAHGFILRYPTDGTYYTGCGAEPWHVRYVGAAAQEITARGVTLEEYLGTLPAAIDYLVLVNAKHALPDDWEDTVEIVHMTNRHGEDVGVERITYEAYCGLRDALAEDGVHLDINSAYRTVSEQRALAESYTRKYGEAYVKAYVAVPGYSEHHTGLAIDLYLESVDVWAKIHARLAEYGFILRYPENGESMTGYAYEPWHIRFVGVETAAEIAGRGITLEEYEKEMSE